MRNSELSDLFLIYECMDAEGGRHTRRQGFDADTYDEAVDMLITQIASTDERLLLATLPDGEAVFKHRLYDFSEGEAELSPFDGSRLVLAVGTAKVQIKRTSEGVIVDLYDADMGECLGTMAATYDECLPELMS